MFEPRLDILPPQQLRLWRALGTVPRELILYGGTAIALRLGHRESVDFDFFSATSLDKEMLRRLPFMADFVSLQDDPDTLVGMVGPENERVKLSFFGGMEGVPIRQPEITSDDMVLVADLPELLGFKLKTLHDRAEGKDYQDIAAILEAGVPLASGMDVAITMFGQGFPVAHTLKALSYFEDLHEAWRVSSDAKRTLLSAVRRFPEDYPLGPSPVPSPDDGGQP
jgi:hypothetical protein